MSVTHEPGLCWLPEASNRTEKDGVLKVSAKRTKHVGWIILSRMTLKILAEAVLERVSGIGNDWIPFRFRVE